MLIVRDLGIQEYETTWGAMRRFTHERTSETPDELWLLEHPSVFTQGVNGKPEHVFSLGAIPLIQSDRGGQITYHGPGQLIAYPLLDLSRYGLGARSFVTRLENTLIKLLAEYHVIANTRCDAPGVYVEAAKIASIGLRIRKNCTYHGIALNVDMDLEPFSRIRPCGLNGLKMTQLSDLEITTTCSILKRQFVEAFINTMQSSHCQVSWV